MNYRGDRHPKGMKIFGPILGISFYTPTITNSHVFMVFFSPTILDTNYFIRNEKRIYDKLC